MTLLINLMEINKISKYYIKRKKIFIYYKFVIIYNVSSNSKNTNNF